MSGMILNTFNPHIKLIVNPWQPLEGSYLLPSFCKWGHWGLAKLNHWQNEWVVQLALTFGRFERQWFNLCPQLLPCTETTHSKGSNGQSRASRRAVLQPRRQTVGATFRNMRVWCAGWPGCWWAWKLADEKVSIKEKEHDGFSYVFLRLW